MCSKEQIHNLLEKLNVGLPTCPTVSLDVLRSRLPDISCWGPPHFLRGGCRDDVYDSADGGVPGGITATSGENNNDGSGGGGGASAHPKCHTTSHSDISIGDCNTLRSSHSGGSTSTVTAASGSSSSRTISDTNTTPLHRFYRQQQRKMPGFRGRRGLCGCFQDDEPPEICVVEGAFTLQTMTPTQPMPTIEELDAKFAELVEELDLTAPNKTAMLSLPPQKKWQIYCSRKSPVDDVDGNAPLCAVPPSPEHYIERIRDIGLLLLSSAPEDAPSPCNEFGILKPDTHTALLDALKTALRTSAHSFVLRFVELQGLPALLDLLQTLDVRVAKSTLHTSLIGCIKALMNNSTGRSHVLAHPTGIDTIAQSLAADNIKTKIAALEILGAVCLVPGGHKKVLSAMLHFQRFAAERARFQGIINDLDRSTGAYRDDVNLKTALMSFINAVLNYGPGQENLEFRLHLRYEFLMLGIQPVIDKLRTHENETLDRHLDFFEMVRTEDEKELARKFNHEHVDTKSSTAMFELLRRKLSHSAAYPHLLSLLQHMLLLPGLGPNTQHWLLFDRVVQQVVLQVEERPSSDIDPDMKPSAEDDESAGRDPDVGHLRIDVRRIVKLLVKEEELVSARAKAEDMERENVEMQAKLAKKEQDLDLRMQEKEDLETSLARMRERLEKESASHSQAVQRALNAEMRAEDLQHRFVQEQHERARLERLVNEGSIPDDQKVAGLIGCNGGGSGAGVGPNAPMPPPPPMPMAAPPPPPPQFMPPPPPPMCPGGPPPPMMQSSNTPLPPNMMDKAKKNVPQPTNPLKSFNWSKLPDAKVQGTVWSELDDSKWYNNIELEHIDKLFSAYQKNGVARDDGSIEDLRMLGKARNKILSVIDSRRAQNCTILLSKLKMSDDEISKAILSMDSNEQLPIDMVEQLLKFTPSAEERALLDEHSEDIDSLARADRFLYEISKIPHYEQRLKSLHYKKRFMITVNDLSPRIASVMEASREVARSRRLRKLLELVLALGNYMNRGPRGNASGFRLASLNRLADTKSSSAKGTTLLHYLVQLIEKKYKDLLKLDEDIPHVRVAAKVSLGEMDKDITMLRTGMADVSREIDFHRSAAGQPPVGDRFLPVMREFHAQASVRFAELEDQFQDMKTRFDRAIRLFGEDGSVVQPDEFFGIFDAFLAAFMEARQDNDNFKRRQEEEEKRAKQEAEMKKRTIDRKNKEGLMSSVAKNLGLRTGGTSGGAIGANGTAGGSNGDTKGEFDDLISALRTGDVFGEDMAKFKRSRKTRLGSVARDAHNTSPPRQGGHHREDSRERTVVVTGRRQ